VWVGLLGDAIRPCSPIQCPATPLFDPSDRCPEGQSCRFAEFDPLSKLSVSVPNNASYEFHPVTPPQFDFECVGTAVAEVYDVDCNDPGWRVLVPVRGKAKRLELKQNRTAEGSSGVNKWGVGDNITAIHPIDQQRRVAQLVAIDRKKRSLTAVWYDSDFGDQCNTISFDPTLVVKGKQITCRADIRTVMHEFQTGSESFCRPQCPKQVSFAVGTCTDNGAGDKCRLSCDLLPGEAPATEVYTCDATGMWTPAPQVSKCKQLIDSRPTEPAPTLPPINTTEVPIDSSSSGGGGMSTGAKVMIIVFPIIVLVIIVLLLLYYFGALKRFGLDVAKPRTALYGGLYGEGGMGGAGGNVKTFENPAYQPPSGTSKIAGRVKKDTPKGSTPPKRPSTGAKRPASKFPTAPPPSKFPTAGPPPVR